MATRQNWQAPRLREAVKVNDPSVQALVRALTAALARNAETDEPPPIATARAQYAGIITRIGTDHALLAAHAELRLAPCSPPKPLWPLRCGA